MRSYHKFVQEGRLSGDSKLEPNSLGIWTLGGDLGIGFVALIETRAKEILLIRKANKHNYEYSGRLALPGGMIRSKEVHSPEFLRDFEYSIQARLEEESGLSPSLFNGLEPLSTITPVTSYTAKGARRHTLVLPLSGKISGQVPLLATSSSVQEPQWVHWAEVVSLIREVAPANCLVLASYLQDRLTPNQRDFIAPAVEKALHDCTGWAEEVGWPSPSFPGLSADSV